MCSHGVLNEGPEVDLAFIMHKLNVDPLVSPKKKRPRRSTKPHVEALKGEVEKLKWSRAIKEVFFSKMVGQYGGGEEER